MVLNRKVNLRLPLHQPPRPRHHRPRAAKHAPAPPASQAMRSREIHRTYQAFALGETAASGTIDAPIARPTAPHPAQSSIGFWQSAPQLITAPRALLLVFSHLELNSKPPHLPVIRVHMAYTGHPLLGDNALYNKNSLALSPPGTSLCIALPFVHPISSEQP